MFLLTRPPLCKYITTKENVYIRKEFHRTGLEHQQGHRFIVLENQYGGREVMWKGSQKAVTIYSATGKNLNTWNISGMFIVLWPITAKTNARELAAKPQTNPLGWSGSESVIRDHSDHGRTNEPMNLEISQESLLCYDRSQRRPRHANWPQNHKLTLWDDLDQDQWSEISRIMVEKMNRWILVQSELIGSLDLPWSEWSWSRSTQRNAP